MARKQLLDRPAGPRLWAVLDEAVLQRPMGDTVVLREQVASLLEQCDHPNIRLQVIPFAYGGHAASGGAFTILRFPLEDLPDTVYLEYLTGALYWTNARTSTGTPPRCPLWSSRPRRRNAPRTSCGLCCVRPPEDQGRLDR
jgi:hypothetical protein